MGGVKEKFGTKHILEKRKIQFEGEKILKNLVGQPLSLHIKAICIL